MSDDDITAAINPKSTEYIPDVCCPPVAGKETKGLLDRKRLPTEAAKDIIEAAISILGSGINPIHQRSRQTGLVVGYIQSGKTLSFTTVMALARDNGYRLIIAVAGTSKVLLAQSTSRLRKDLFLDDDPVSSLRWVQYTNPTDTENIWGNIEQVLDEWRDPLVPETERPTVLITVMKHHNHLGNLVSLLRHLNLKDVPTLIVDDEADQASLNNLVNQKLESTTYRRLLELRDTVPYHTFIQYTATPQAPLLINIIDSLSPDFVKVLDPGEDYVGGQTFFGKVSGLVRMIPPDEVPTDDNPIIDPPSSLLDALRVFFVGLADGLIKGRSATNANRSMLVHPSRKTAQHQEYAAWIGEIFNEWNRLILLPEADPDRTDLIEDFRKAHTDISRTVQELSDFEEIKDMLPRAFRRTSIEVVNTRGVNGKRKPTPEIIWQRTYGWILVGGQSMDRGFTVEGLTVTYMPRGPGARNADTIQQRGRFFGYKQTYLGYCRIYLEQDLLTAFEEYVWHEQDMRRQLQDVSNVGGQLSEWKRAFVLSPILHPCRSNVIQYDYARGHYADAWFEPRVVLNATSVMDENRKTTQDFIAGLSFHSDEGSSNRKPAQMHNICRDVLLIEVVERLLLPYRFTSPVDSQKITGVLLQLSHALEQNRNEKCVIYRMSPDFPRRRKVDNKGRIRQLFQGAVPVKPPERQGSIYRGDREMHDRDKVTVQLHFVDIMQGKSNEIIADNVPIIAVWIPRSMELPWLTQEQP